MNSNRYQRLALAVALGVGVSASALPHGFAAEEMDSTAANTAAEMAGTAAPSPVLSDAPAAPADTAAAPAEGAPVLTGSTPSGADQRAAEWAAKRPAEDAISNDLAAQVGKTIVEINFSGASAATEPTARAALTMHVGDAVTEDAAAPAVAAQDIAPAAAPAVHESVAPPAAHAPASRLPSADMQHLMQVGGKILRE